MNRNVFNIQNNTIFMNIVFIFNKLQNQLNVFLTIITFLMGKRLGGNYFTID